MMIREILLVSDGSLIGDCIRDCQLISQQNSTAAKQ